MKILVTGSAGFIGTHLVHALHRQGHDVVGLDNLNALSDEVLKHKRLLFQGIESSALTYGQEKQSDKLLSYRFLRLDLNDKQALMTLFEREKFDVVCNLAAQAGVRASIEHPEVYIEANLVGFSHLLECCRRFPVRHLVYASSSSVYGANKKIPYAESDPTDQPMSLYAATKKANELMAYTYSSLFGIPATGLRFFTVYGPWGRTNMAPYLFMRSIYEGKPIKVFNKGNLSRDFTYIDDIIEGILHVVASPSGEQVPHRVFNIGHSDPVSLMDFIATIEQVMGKTAQKEFLPMQAGDVETTYADTTALSQTFGYTPKTSLPEGIRLFYNWFIAYYENK